MFKTITRLFFGEEEEGTPQEVKSGEELEEDWLVVSHQEAVSAENQGTELTASQQTNSALNEEPVANIKTDVSVSDPEPTLQSSSPTSHQAVTGSVLQPKALLEASQLTSVQRAKAWVDRHHMTRNAIQRQNRVRQGVHHHFFPLHQPGHRNLSH